MIDNFSAEDARRLTEQKNIKVKDFISDEKMNKIFIKIQDRITSYRDSSFHGIRSEYKWSGDLTEGEKEYLKNEGYTVEYDSCHGDSWYIIKW